MSVRRHDEAMRLFNAARRLEGEARSEFLGRECGVDVELRREVETLLEFDAEDIEDAFHEEVIDSEWPETTMPSAVGPYTILGVLGSGGMAVVYRARQTNPERDVALKVLRRGLPSRSSLRRFQYEAQALARLHHVGIAQIYEAGTDLCDGVRLAFFAMELIRGKPITTHAAERGLATREKLELIARVCDAVEHAHQRGVIHRDLKPGNILVDESGRPKILDFGIARIVAPDDPAATLMTEVGQVLGTVPYMSPEQATGDPNDLDLRSDVYALGILAYEILAEKHPHDFAGKTLTECLRTIAEEVPPSLGLVGRSLRGDVETIVSVALEKDKERRYRSAGALAGDIRRYLADETIHARPAGRVYELRTFARRNRGLVFGLGAAVLAIVVGAAAALWSYLRADDALDELRQLADARLLQQLEDASEELWPARPERIGDLEAWQAEAAELLARIPLHERTLDRIRGNALPYSQAHRRRDVADATARLSVIEEELAELRARRDDSRSASGRDSLEDEIDDLEEEAAAVRESALVRSTWTFEDSRDSWHHDVLATLVRDLRHFAHEESGVVADVQRRLAFARSVRKRTVVDHADAWQRACEAIRRNERYRGLEIEPQIGLVPLGADPRSTFEEFLHLQSHAGRVPSRTEDGVLALHEEVGIVLVLLPGGTFRMGAEEADIGMPRDDELPAHDVRLAPFFIAKHELTMGQWKRIRHSLPGRNRPGMITPNGNELTSLHPVSNIDWNDAAETMKRLGLVLPTEAQWEYAARGGTTTVWWTGDRKESLVGAINVADQTARRAGIPWAASKDWPELDDGYAIHAPVDRLRPNPFGLHHVYGNVYEWCRDRMGGYRNDVAPGDGERLPPTEPVRMYRGGSFSSSVRLARSSARAFQLASYRSHGLGVRASRIIER